MTNWIANDINDFLKRNGYTTTINAEGFVEVQDPVRSNHGDFHETVVIKSWAEASRFVEVRS